MEWRCRGGGKHGQELRAGHNHVHLRFRHAKRVLETALQCVIQADEGMSHALKGIERPTPSYRCGPTAALNA